MGKGFIRCKSFSKMSSGANCSTFSAAPLRMSNMFWGIFVWGASSLEADVRLNDFSYYKYIGS